MQLRLAGMTASACLRSNSARRWFASNALVCHQGVEAQPFDQGRHPGNFAALTRKQRKAHEVAKRVCQRQNFRRQPAL